ncbi:MAG: family 20 glycosylhydrolase [Bacteroidota bacterium]|nr:family 20 glycosylhydrolase [Bacteroidota bacterium]
MRKNIFFIFMHAICLCVVVKVQSQVTIPFFPDSLFSTYYHQRLTHFNTLPVGKDEIIFLGNSITDGAEWSELLGSVNIKNRGISGDITVGVLNRLPEIIRRKPKKVFLLIGINDLARNISPDSVVKNIILVAAILHQYTPSTKLYIQSLLPVNDVYKKFTGHTNKGAQIIAVNKQLQSMAGDHHYTFVDLYHSFCDEEGKMRASLTNDGLHLKGEAYLLWKHIIYPYVFDLQQRPSLLPLPQHLEWTNVVFPLYECSSIVVSDSIFRQQAFRLQSVLNAKGVVAGIKNSVDVKPYILLKKEITQSVDERDSEAYQLEVTGNHVVLSASTEHGIFNAIQTLQQLLRDGVMIDGCNIRDKPAFSWRGFMVDVGRNYQSLSQLKKQIEIMSLYKLNVFHFHPTEDIAWRLSINQYPQLTAPENMLRGKGLYYTEQDIQELITYCKDRFITFIPEIDMPGHSAAFKRAMKTDMQSDSGIHILQNILHEVCTTYDASYLHVGGDEVKIVNKTFLPEMIKYLESVGKKTIGWSPGGNLPVNTIRQLWMDDAGITSSASTTQYLDSRHLYINHMDPQESVVTIFKRQIGNRVEEDKNVKGGILCVWNDRNVASEEDILQMNPVYPALLAFAERSWKGGGQKGWSAIIGKPGTEETKAFAAFENRLLDQKKRVFVSLPFPYQSQSSYTWNFYGPYCNKGLLTRAFAPELNEELKDSSSLQVVGGTIILKHWWYPLIEGAIAHPAENTTWYATTNIWSDEDVPKDFWIGFYDFSRSTATDSPDEGTWDHRHSCIWINGNVIAPPVWKHAGQKGNLEVPLTDEGYAYREPTRVMMHKGWNKILIKLPVGSFKGKDWQNPVKWMFTCVPVR